MSNFNFNFSVGARVYYPEVSNKVLTLKESLSPEYPLETNWTDLSGDLNGDSFTENGRRSIFSLNPCIFPATQEWYERLVVIYPNLEKPPKRKGSKEIIQAMLDDGWDCVPCYVHDENKTPNKNNRREIISEARNYSNYPFVTDTVAWKYAIPFDPKTGKTIVDYVDGEVVLEG